MVRLIGSKESGSKKYMIAKVVDEGCVVTDKTWSRYVDRCRNAGETPVNPEDEGIIITSANIK